MLTFEQKKEIIGRFSELTEKSISMNRLNYHFEGSKYDKKIVVEKLHPNGNGFVYVGDLLAYKSDERGLFNIRDVTEQQLLEVIEDSIMYLTEVDEPKEEVKIEESWRNASHDQLLLVQEDEYWNVYHGFNLEESFGTKEDAEQYLIDEGFKEAK
ncbi:hypothetical protein [Kurthia sibirica]|uniref:Uncharacterized protein n=1 Tax=Kurthia sibirica TaxID=202750 RepID=A0A2U3AKH0_9BACL|nr:hypothetical protein [Kurthia sibirica]PWI25038.1 hypothetical protein DEX24_09840 [Kurthia sibirica]GEK34202.1 hypothetical protein KSI01_17350 [Kurthia sibirica]